MVKIGIYKITSPSNKVYIGQTTNWEQRENDYKILNVKRQPKIYRSLLKYGVTNHKFEIIEECPVSYLDELEFWWKIFYNSVEDGLNCHYIDGKGGYKSEEHKKKISIANKGKIISKETKLKISNSNKGKKRTKEQCLKISKIHMGKPQPEGFGDKISKILKENNHSKYYTQEVRNKMGKKPKGFGKKISKALKGKNNTHRSKPVLQYDLKGKFIKEYPSIAEAARILKVKTSGIVQCCTGTTKSAYGYVWKHK